MAKYGIPTNQFSEYRTSVHWNALAKRGDLSAPNCASCHGNHGAKPPEVESVAAVCGSCHVLFAQLYEKSVHQPISSGAAGGGGAYWGRSGNVGALGTGEREPTGTFLALVTRFLNENPKPGSRCVAEG